MRLTLFVVLFALAVSFAPGGHAQQARNAVYFELGGSAVAPSFNYERRVREAWFGRVGLSVVTGETAGSDDTDTSVIIPVTLSWVRNPASNHHLELGGGLTFLTGEQQEFFELGDDEEELSAVLATGIVGYRYQKPDGGFQFRAVFTPVVGSGLAAPWAGVSFGYAW